MAGETTGLVIFSHRSVFEEIHGPAYSRLWRPGYLAALVEKHVPLWVITPIAHAAKSHPVHEIIMCNPDLGGPLEMNLMPFMASIFSQNNLDLRLKAENEGLKNLEGGTWWINGKSVNHGVEEELDENGEIVDRIEEIDFIFPSSKIYEMSIPLVANTCRVTSIRYPGSALLASDGVSWMRAQGVDVDEFVYKSAGMSGSKF
jgi:hypothetical protein